ncbi:MAG: hypothetical protein L6R37_004403 [Teloschistes peruensis]|nr:MAG: hypothetical protein L6R37_004403 [Teloschistes peruensis]
MADSESKYSSKRSRFDQTEPEPKRSSRFDRRSRSPSRRESEVRRSRSPLASSQLSSSGAGDRAAPKAFAADPAAAAGTYKSCSSLDCANMNGIAAAAARINASIQAKKGIQHVDVPPIQSSASPVGKASSPPAKSSGSSTSNINGDMYIADGDYIKDIEVNDLRNRYTLTKGSTQKMIKEETGADVTTRGEYYPDKSMATAANPPLYLHITSTSKDGLEKAVVKIEEMMKQDLPNLVDERRFRRREPEQVERDEFGRRKWPEERIPIDLEAIPGFNLRAQVVGHGGAYVKHIQQETRCRVQIKGRNSGYMEHGTNRESDEPMFLHVAGPDPKEVQHARELCEDLLANVKEQYERFKENPPNRGYGGGYGQENRQQGGYSTQNPYGTYGGGGGAAQSPSTPSSATPGPPGASGADYTAQYAQYYATLPGGDPYAAYGGYANYLAYYQYYQQQAVQQQAGAPGAAGAGAGAPPAPPGEEAPPPPPPPPSGSPPANGGYNNVGVWDICIRMCLADLE